MPCPACVIPFCSDPDTCFVDDCPQCGCGCAGHGCALCLGDEWPENERNREIEEHRAIGKGLVAPLFDLTPIPRPHETGEKVSDDE